MPFARFTFAPALPFRFHSRHSSAVASRPASLPYSLHPRGTGFGKRMLRDNHPARLALSFALVVFLSVRDSANSSLRPTNRNTRLLAFFHAPSVSRSRYQNYRPSPSLSLFLSSSYSSTFVLGRSSNGRPVVAIRLEALFSCRNPDVFILRNEGQVL